MSSLEPISSSDDIGNFLDFLYGESEGYVYVPTREQNRGAWKQEFFHWPEQKQQIENYIRLNTGDREVYIAPAMFSEKSSLKEAFLRSHVVWAELDGKSPVLNDVPQPTLKVQTSSHHHEHWYWKLTEPITSKSELEQINGSLTYSLGADVSGWDCNQVLRPPSTINHKRSRATSLLYRGDSEYSPLSFTHLKPGPIATTEIDQTTIPDVTTVILKYAFNEQSISQFRASPAEGERSTALMSLGHLCAEMGMTDGEIFSVVRNADDRWGKFKDRTDRNKRLSDLIARVRLKHPYLNADDNQKKARPLRV